MSEIHATPKSTKLRYRAYFWLMDASLIGICLFVASVIYQTITGIEAFGLPLTVQYIAGLPLLILILFVPMILILGSPLRDEYAQLLWQRTVAPMVVLMATLPVLFFLSLWVLYGLSVDVEASPALKWIYEEKPAFEFLSGVWLIFNMAFVVIFQFLRLKDSR